MSLADRPLSPAVIEALTYWPGIVHPVAPTPVDLGVLPTWFNELLDEWPWWDRAWRVTRVEPAHPCEIARDEPRAVSRFTEVTVPGTVSRHAGDTLPLSARVRFSDDLLIRFQAKVGDVVIGPGSAAAGVPERHPFGSVLGTLMDLRGISVREMAVRCGRSMSTINMVRSGSWNPHRILVAELAEALDMSEEDLLAIAGLAVHP
ncbi:helix-turn-helix domain-containing protein [Micromonospora sp. NPDC049836]|uniref:helix-turn-helix domain-containing protein n=1 Tax=Micromonospora sp. NPDC049836 TaxID=3364274 RepID=UPI003792F760